MKRLIWLVAVGAALAAYFLHGHEHLPDFLEWVRARGVWGALVIAAVYVAATVCMVPGSLLTIGMGFVYGPGWGLLLVSPASVLGASLTFVLGRTLLRSSVERRLAGSARLRALDQAMEDGGLRIVLLTRLSPVFPFVLLNYAFGLTRVRFASFLLGSFVGMLPGTFLYVYLGSSLEDVSEIAGAGAGTSTGVQVLQWLGLGATLVVTVFITRLARRALREAAPGAVQAEEGS